MHLWLSSTWRQRFQKAPFVHVSVDETPAATLQTREGLPQPVTIEIPAGAEDHVWKLSAPR